jgi:hypothetical protein
MHAGRAGLCALALAGVVLALSIGCLAVPAGALGGEWEQVSCVNPNGSAAGSQGWVTMIAGGGYGSNSDSNCGPGAPAFALLSADAAVAVGSAETLRYIPPAGSTLNGGRVNVAMFADGRGFNASGTAVAYSPEYIYNGSNVFFQCASGLPPCASGGYDYAGTLELPAARGGELYLSAGCGGEPGQSCNQGGSEGAWSLLRLYWAQLALSNGATPAAGGFGGTLLAANAHGTSDLTFTASDPEGPGVYRVLVQADGTTLYDATPDQNAGACVPVGASGAILMFDSSQPCRRTETIDLPLDTTLVTDGPHTLKVTVSDAAGNSSVVYDAPMTVQNGPAVTDVLGDLSTMTALGAPNGEGASQDARLVIRSERNIRRRYQHRALSLSGSLSAASGAPIAGATLDVLTTPPGGPAPRVLGHALTAPDGSFTAHVPPGPSRRIALAYRAFAGAPGYAAQAHLSESVSAAVALGVTPRSTGPTGTITLSGRVAGPLPRRGVVVELLVHYRGAWEPFRDPRTDAHGRFSVRYRFEGARGRFPFRAAVLGEQAGFPYASAQSRVVDVQSN